MFVPPTTISEQLLYDFNLQVGDTVKGYMTYNGAINEQILSIDSVLVGTEYHKRWRFNHVYGVYIVEGIGSIWGLIERSPGYVSEVPRYEVLCFSENGVTLYPASGGGCNIFTNISNQAEYKCFSVFPNPSNGQFEIGGFNERLARINIYDVSGRILKSFKPNRTVDLNGILTKGVYLVELEDIEGKKNIQRFVFQ